jgi:hypothetical protein
LDFDLAIVVASARFFDAPATPDDMLIYRLFGDPFLLTVTRSGSGSVTSSPSGINCGSSCSDRFDDGTKVTLTATPKNAFFRGWSGGGCSGRGKCVVTLTNDTAVHASFTPELLDLPVLVNAALVSGELPPIGPILVTIRLVGGRIPPGGPIVVTIRSAYGFPITGRLGGSTIGKVVISKRRRVRVRAKRFSVKPHSKKRVRLRLPKALRRVLRRKHKLKLRLKARVKGPAGGSRVVKKRVTLKLKKKRKRRAARPHRASSQGAG